MTADEARGRVGEIRVGLRRAMRQLSGPVVDWREVTRAVFDALCVVSCLYRECQMEDFERRRYDSVYQGDDHGGGATQDGA